MFVFRCVQTKKLRLPKAHVSQCSLASMWTAFAEQIPTHRWLGSPSLGGRQIKWQFYLYSDEIRHHLQLARVGFRTCLFFSISMTFFFFKFKLLQISVYKFYLKYLSSTKTLEWTDDLSLRLIHLYQNKLLNLQYIVKSF